MAPGMTRGALKTLVMLGALIFIISEILKEINFASQLSIQKSDSHLSHKIGQKQEEGAKQKDESEKKQSELKRLAWLAEVKKIMEADPSLSPLLKQFPKTYQQDNPELIQIIRDKYLLSPSDDSYNIESTKDPSMGQAQLIRRILRNKRNGVFIECGAFDGETRSNTLFLEKELDWSGVIIEADPDNLKKIRSKHRKSWLVPACLSTREETMFVTFGAWASRGRIVKNAIAEARDPEMEEPTIEGDNDHMVNVSCLPLFSILQAFNNPSIDYFSLDVEGSELAILKTIPFDKVDIKTISVEFFHLDERGYSSEELKTFMEAQGYVYHSTVKAKKNHANHFIFVKKHLKIE